MKVKIQFINKIKKSIKSFLYKRTCSTPYLKFKLFYSYKYSIIERWKKEGEYEYKTISKIISLLKEFKSPVFIDIGSNIGMISLSILDEINNLKVYAFEPGPHQYSLFKKTIAENNLQGSITLSELALSDKKEIAHFAVHSFEHTSGDGFVDTQRAGNVSYINVKTDTLDSWWEMQKFPDINLIKIDTEGAEYLILKGGRNLISKLKPFIILEINSLNLKNFPYSHYEIIDELNSLGYSLYNIDGQLVTKENFKSYEQEDDNFIAYPKSPRL